MLQRLKARTANIGFFAVGHAVYWDQFEGLLEQLMGYHSELRELLENNEVVVKDYGMIDTSEGGYAALEQMRGDGLDLLFCNMITYATSSTFAPILRGMDVPIVLLALQPLEAMDYTKASTYMQLANDNICSVPEFTNVAVRMGKKVDDIIIGTLYNDTEAQEEIKSWCDIAKVLHDLKGARLALMGHVLEAMYDMHADPTAISAAFGVHVPLLEIDDVVRLYETVTESEIAVMKEKIVQEFDMPNPVSDPVTMKLSEADLQQAAHSAVALNKLVEAYNLTGLAYYYEGLEGSLQRRIASSFIVGNSMLNAQGVPMCGEYDIKTLLAMLIMDRLDIGGSFAEFHPFDFKENFILVGHDGPHHIAIADSKPILRSLVKYHGKPGSGASVEFKIKEGPITMLGITQTEKGFKFVIGEGMSRKGAIPPTGNTNTRGFFEPNAKAFVKAWAMEGPTHHFALGIGHHAQTLHKIAGVLGIESVIVKPSGRE
ncbi:L-fucose/L-arabinose isomerase family protein [Paenibacillus sp. HB172176]|uniref:L-fucose/L-arabinose isomerase family protein n=1 Tax=Paenibacillus sp. HB172176 TaxID=2493690 RepID=UPI0019811AF8|nr:L-fucose/L-arabinose isomerase family protein [Paenibacillus sp. HB172176]